MWEQPGAQCYPAINPELTRKGLKWGQRLIEEPSKEESSKKKKKKLQYFSICSSVSAVFCVACIASPFPVTLMSHFRYPLAPVLMSAGSVRRAHLSQNWWPVRRTSLNTQTEGIKKPQIFSFSLPEEVHQTVFVLSGGLRWNLLAYQTLLEGPKYFVIKKASKGLIQCLSETSSFSSTFTEINE